MSDAVEVCPECDVAGCSHIRDRTGPFAPATPQAHTHATPDDSAMAETARADALRGLIAMVEDPPSALDAGHTSLCDLARVPFYVFAQAFGSLDAVARLEAPLRERGWRGPQLDPPLFAQDAEWGTKWFRDEWLVNISPVTGRMRHLPIEAQAPTEARARLLAVLRAHLHEEEAR